MRLSEVKTESDNLTNFISLMKKYTEFKELTQEILYSFVDRIEIGEKEKFSHNTQKNKNHLQLHRCSRHPAGITPNIAFSKVNKPWEKVSRRKANERCGTGEFRIYIRARSVCRIFSRLLNVKFIIDG